MNAAWTERWVELREIEGEYFAYEAGIVEIGGTDYWAEKLVAGPCARLVDAGLAADEYAEACGLEVEELSEEAAA